LARESHAHGQLKVHLIHFLPVSEKIFSTDAVFGPQSAYMLLLYKIRLRMIGFYMVAKLALLQLKQLRVEEGLVDQEGNNASLGTYGYVG
jgi:hypothetical protein